MKQLYLSTALLLGASAAGAGQFCEIDGTEMFSCTLKGGTRGVEVCDVIWLDGAQAAYGFFQYNGTIEKEIFQDLATITATPWNGIGNSITEAVTFDGGGGYAYEVWSGSERATGAVQWGGINVLENGKVIAVLNCDEGTVESDLTSLIDMIEAAK